MPTHSIEKVLPYSQDQLYKMVSDVSSYPEFLPWCEAARILEDNGDVIIAELIIKFRGIHGRYTSRVFLDDKDKEISVELVQGPFKHLYNGWKFSKAKEGGTLVEFDIDFTMRSKIFEKVVDFMFDEVLEHMIEAFEKRAKTLFG